MVDALLIAAQSEDSEYFEDKEDDVPQLTPQLKPQQHTQPQVRICEFCGSSNTPTWRRGPGGKGSLCNACGIKWRLRKRTKKGDTIDKAKSSKTPSAKRKKRETNIVDQSDHMTSIRNPIVFKENIQHDTFNTSSSSSSPSPSLSPSSADSRKNYFCKFCNKTWDFHHFKNSQQFGAHCSNCSRRPQQDGLVPPSPHLDDLSSSPFPSPALSSSPSSLSSFSSPSLSSPSLSTPNKRFPPPFEDPGLNLILMLRYMQEEDELSDGETVAPPSPSLPLPTPVL